MNSPPPPPGLFDPVKSAWYRWAANGWVPARWYLPELPTPSPNPPAGRLLRLEIVTHCWQYAPFLIQQLNSIIRFPPANHALTVTVYHAASDTATANALAAFGEHTLEHVHWNWRILPETSLFRRAIGRNDAAKRTQADWVWFTDCDVLFRENCLDAVALAVAGRTDHLVFPASEWVTDLLPPDHPMIRADAVHPFGEDVDSALFKETPRTRATGPLQIVHGDTARACGYCDCLAYYQKPVAKWAKAFEDRALRWLLRTPGTPINAPGVFRIRHQAKGRYHGKTSTRLRQSIRRLQPAQSWQNDERK